MDTPSLVKRYERYMYEQRLQNPFLFHFTMANVGFSGLLMSALLRSRKLSGLASLILITNVSIVGGAYLRDLDSRFKAVALPPRVARKQQD